MLSFMVGYVQGPIAVRYPRGRVTEDEFPSLLERPRPGLLLGKAEVLKEPPGFLSGRGADVLFAAFGSMVGPALEASRLLEEKGITSVVLNARFAKPLDRETLLTTGAKCEVVLTVEECCLTGSFGSAVLELFSKEGEGAGKITCLGIPDQFIEHGSRKILLDLVGLSPEKIASSAETSLQKRRAGQTRSRFSSYHFNPT